MTMVINDKEYRNVIGFDVTGTDRDGKRFCRKYGADAFYTARSINVYRGTLWVVTSNMDGTTKRSKLVEYYN